MAAKRSILVGLAGQQNSGKSTIFNMLTGASQHVANYPGVTVDKKVGSYRDAAGRVEVVDLPGTYSLTSYSLEERVARDFLINGKPDVVVNVLDASQLKRSLYFTFQLMEMGLPVLVAANMMDVADSSGRPVDAALLAETLGVTVVPTVGRKAQGRDELRRAIRETAERGARTPGLAVTYQGLDSHLRILEERLAEAPNLALAAPPRWLAVKLLEGDLVADRILEETHPDWQGVRSLVETITKSFEAETGLSPSDHIMSCRDQLASRVVEECVTPRPERGDSMTKKVDRVVLNRLLAPLVLVLSVYLIYEISIVQGYKLTEYSWPVLAWLRGQIALLLPDPGLLEDPLLRTMVLWMVDSANTLLNYAPIFFVLFALIAIMEDSGYMARIAFILDRIFQGFGLHGQSTLPFILGGVFAGGCAVPGVMATKGIPDERSRLATILTVPYMNCLAKTPLYILLVNIYFAAYKSWAMLFISTITIILALIIAKLLTATILRNKATAPFVMEMPTYHLPTLRGILTRSCDRTWQYIKKVGTIVVAVSVCVYILLQFPGVPRESLTAYQGRMDQAMADFRTKAGVGEGSPYQKLLEGKNLEKLLLLYGQYREAKLAAGAEGAGSLNDGLRAGHPDFYPLLVPGRDKQARKISRALRGLFNKRKTIRRQMRSEKIANSFFGHLGRALEPVTRLAGFDWKVNIALISSFAARESSVATLGAIFQEGAEEGATLESRMASEGKSEGRTPLGALAIIIFFALYPPCLATTIMVKVQTGSYKWMLFSIAFPTLLGLVVASAVFTGGNLLGFSGIQSMAVFYVMALFTAVVLFFVPDPAWNTGRSGPPAPGRGEPLGERG